MIGQMREFRCSRCGRTVRSWVDVLRRAGWHINDACVCPRCRRIGDRGEYQTR